VEQKKNKREVAWRIFAREFNAATVELPGEDQYAPTYVVSPMGAMINRVYITGVLTECENIGTEHEPLWRGRVSDPTDVFYISAGQFQPKAAQTLAELEVPALIGIVGKARTYSPDDMTTYVSIRVEQVKVISQELRNYWVLEACRGLNHRMGCMVEALRMDPPEINKLLSLGFSKKISQGILESINQFGTIQVQEYGEILQNTLKELSTETNISVEGSTNDDVSFQLASDVDDGAKHQIPNFGDDDVDVEVGNVEQKEEPGETATGVKDQQDLADESGSEVQEKLVFEIITSLIEEQPDGVVYEDVQTNAAEQGLDRAQVEEFISSLIDKGVIYEPSIGLFKTV
jgi:RPA family protein